MQALRDHIRKTVAAEVARLTSEGTSSSRYGYGPRKLTPNKSGEPTPQSNATTQTRPATESGDLQSEEAEDIPYVKPSVADCLFQSYHFERDFRVGAIPTFPHEEYVNADSAKKRPVANAHKYRAKRETPHPRQYNVVKNGTRLREERNSPPRLAEYVFVSFV